MFFAPTAQFHAPLSKKELAPVPYLNNRFYSITPVNDLTLTVRSDLNQYILHVLTFRDIHLNAADAKYDKDGVLRIFA